MRTAYIWGLAIAFNGEWRSHGQADVLGMAIASYPAQANPYLTQN